MKFVKILTVLLACIGGLFLLSDCRKGVCVDCNLGKFSKADALSSSYILSDCLAYKAALYENIAAGRQGAANFEAEMLVLKCPQ